MFEWLMNLPQWFQIVMALFCIISMILVVISLVILIFSLIKKGFKVKNNLLEFSINKEDINVGGGGYTSPHKNCAYNKDVTIIINELTKLLHEKYMLMYSTQTREQMNYAEQKINQMRNTLQNAYLEALEAKGLSRSTAAQSCSTYRSVLREVQFEIIALVRHSFRENHLSDMSEQSFQIYVDEKFEYIASRTSELLDNLYFYDKDLSREELYRVNKRQEHKVKSACEDIYQTARAISVSYKQKSLDIDETINSLISRYI